MILDKPFGKIRGFFFPIHGHEMRKFVPLMLLMILICFNYTILRNTKDALILSSSGAQAIPFIKVWAMLPTAILVTYAFTRLNNAFGQERVFYIMISSFLAVYALFIFVFYPHRDALHPHALADSLRLTLPAGFHGLVSIFEYWSFTLFYVMSELWSSMIMTTLFWGFANEVTRIWEARRFYSVLAIAGNVAAFLAGAVGKTLTKMAIEDQSLSAGFVWERVLQLVVITVIIAGVSAMALFWYMNRTTLKGPGYETLHLNQKALRAKGKVSVRDSLHYLSTSKYLLCIAVIVVAYNLVINLVEIVWKDRLSTLFDNPIDIQNYMNYVSIATSITATITALFLAGIIARFGWTKTALLTPITMLVTCCGFFGFLFFEDTLADTALAIAGTTPLAIAVFFGGAQNALSRAAKYSVFDATKEMAFIPLDHDAKLKGKAVIDGVGSRLGKSGGSLIHQSLLFIFVTIVGITPYVAVILFICIGLWIYATRALGRQFNELVASQQATDEEARQESHTLLHDAEPSLSAQPA